MHKDTFSERLDEVRAFHEKATITAIVQEPSELPLALTFTYVKRYPRFSRIKLTDSCGAQEDCRGRSIRDFDKKLYIKERAISKVLSELRGRDMTASREREYPSAGARYPIETYILAWRIEGVPSGVYHYDLRSHALECVLPDTNGIECKKIVSPYVTHPACALLFTACLSRTVIKYGLRGYPYALIETGHIGQTVLMAARKQAIDACCIGGFVGPFISQLLDLPNHEVPVYVIALGHR